MATTRFLPEVMVVFHPQSIIMLSLMGQAWQEFLRRNDTDEIRDVVFSRRANRDGWLK